MPHASLSPSGMRPFMSTQFPRATDTGSDSGHVDPHQLYLSAILVPVLAFPAWILCIPPLVWHYSQRNIAAWSLVVWIIVGNFFLSINALIWPRDNLQEWWSGTVLCDIQVRFMVGESVALAACTAMIMRKLAVVMDTRNITVAPSKRSRLREKILEAIWCWGYPILMMLVYYIVQPQRYIIYQIAGCGTIYDSSWPSIVLVLMWPTITICFAAYFAGLLIYRLRRYRQEFHTLISARDTTKSRFMRLFLMSILVIVFLMPYCFYILFKNAEQVTDNYNWDTIHGPSWNGAIEVPMQGQVPYYVWIHIVQGYVIFVIFGTGTDAYNTYKRMLCAIGLGKLFPSLYRISESGTSTPSSLALAQSWVSTYTSKAKSVFSRKSSIVEALPTRSNSIPTSPIMLSTSRTMSLNPIPTNDSDPILQLPSHESSPQSRQPFLGRIFTRHHRKPPLLPIFAKQSAEKTTSTAKPSPIDIQTAGVSAHAWASDSPTSAHLEDVTPGMGGVRVIREVIQDEKRTSG